MKHAKEHTLHTPRVTEKAAFLAEKGCYVFNVHPDANKAEIAAAVVATYKVTPRQVRIVPVPRRRVMTRSTGRFGSTKGGKKAYVYLKEGDRIEIA